jgi:hypothetical protein
LSNKGFRELGSLKVEFTIVYAMQLMKKENALLIAGEIRGGETQGKRFDVIYVIDTRTNKLLGTW